MLNNKKVVMLLKGAKNKNSKMNVCNRHKNLQIKKRNQERKQLRNKKKTEKHISTADVNLMFFTISIIFS